MHTMHALCRSAHVAITRAILQQSRRAPIRTFSAAADSIRAAAAAVAVAKQSAPSAQRIANNDQRPVCSFCNKKGHTEAVCFAKHGAPNRPTAAAPAASEAAATSATPAPAVASVAAAPAVDAAPIAAVPVAGAPVYKRSVPSRRQWASAESIQILKEKGLERPRSKQPKEGTGTTPSASKIRSLNRGAPPPRPMLPTPPAFRSVDKPWMQSELQLRFDAPQASDAAGTKAFSLRIAQWTGLEEGPVSSWRPPRRQHKQQSDDASEQAEAEWVPEPEWSPEQLAQEAEIQARTSAGSGTIVWDAALHLAHWLHVHPASLIGPVIELGSGTGVLGLAAEHILRSKGDANDATVVLTDEGKVIELLKHNVQTNQSKGQSELYSTQQLQRHCCCSCAHMLSLLLVCTLFSLSSGELPQLDRRFRLPLHSAQHARFVFRRIVSPRLLLHDPVLRAAGLHSIWEHAFARIRCSQFRHAGQRRQLDRAEIRHDKEAIQHQRWSGRVLHVRATRRVDVGERRHAGSNADDAAEGSWLQHRSTAR